MGAQAASGRMGGEEGQEVGALYMLEAYMVDNELVVAPRVKSGGARSCRRHCDGIRRWEQNNMKQGEVVACNKSWQGRVQRFIVIIGFGTCLLVRVPVVCPLLADDYMYLQVSTRLSCPPSIELTGTPNLDKPWRPNSRIWQSGQGICSAGCKERLFGIMMCNKINITFTRYPSTK